MGSELDIQMKQFNGTDYDNLFPKTKGTLVEGIYTADETLTNDVKGLYGLGANATPDEIFRTIYNKFYLIESGKALINLVIQTASGNKLSGIRVGNILTSDGQPAVSNSNGLISGFVNKGRIEIGFKGYADIVDNSITLDVNGGEVYNETLTITTRNFLKYTSSTQAKFSDNVLSVDVTAVGGGASGSKGRYGGGASGGGGGFCTVEYGKTITPDNLYQVVVGAGGATTYDGPTLTPGNKGGDSSFLGVVGQGASAPTSFNGVSIGNGRGGLGNSAYSKDGVAGNVAGFSSFTETVFYGGGGAGVGPYLPEEGFEYIGKPAGYGGARDINGQNGFGGGGGGGYGSAGGSGCIAIRMHLKST